MKSINLSLVKKTNSSYKILIKPAILKEIALILEKEGLIQNKILVLCDTNTQRLFGKDMLFYLKQVNPNSYIYEFPFGEENKNIATKSRIEDFMFENNFTRDSLIIALGGGVVGDLGGFVAATFNRGIPFVQVPTTLLAQIDSSIGGKAGIDTKYGKNLIGAFHQPSIVIIDPCSLLDLDDKQFNSGMAECIKHAVINSFSLFSFIKNNKDKIANKNIAILEELIEKNCNIKKSVVEKDEKEANLRQILNFGHTIGHAIEKLMDYEILHGECIAIGMIVEAKISLLLGHLAKEELYEIENMLKAFKLPTTVPTSLNKEEIYKTTLLDKKTKGNTPHYSLPIKIGSMLEINGQYSCPVDKDIVMKAL